MTETPGSNRPIWLSETTHPELSEKLKKDLKKLLILKLGSTLFNWD